MIKKGKKEFEIKTVSYQKQNIRTLGGLTIVPDCSLEEIHEDNTVALLLPGANTWNDKTNDEILQMAVTYLEKGLIKCISA